MFLHRDSSHRGAHFAEDPQSKLASRLAVTLWTKYDLKEMRELDSNACMHAHACTHTHKSDLI